MIAVHIDRSSGLTVYTACGPLREQEVAAKMLHVFEREPPRLSLWDLRDADGTGLDREEVQWLAAAVARHGAIRAGGRIAVVAPGEVERELADLAKSVVERERSPFALDVFRDMEAAREWLDLAPAAPAQAPAADARSAQPQPTR